MESKIYVVGIGPGSNNQLTFEAKRSIGRSNVIVGYKTYIHLISNLIQDKQIVCNGMKKEIERCESALNLYQQGNTVCVISSGDPGIYGMAGLMLELNDKRGLDADIEIIPGVSAVNGASALLGAPLMHDFCVISLSDLLTEMALIEKRLHCAGEGDFVTVIYNPKSKSRTKHIEKAREIMLKYKNESTPVGIVKNAYREGQSVHITTLSDMLSYDIDMTTIVIIGNKMTQIQNGKMVTPRGYHI